MWFLYALLGASITGVGQVLVKKGQSVLTPLLDNFLAVVIVNLVLVPLLFLFGVDINAGKDIWVYALLAASMYAIFYYIISMGEVSLMISLINTFPIVTIILAISLLNEFPNVYQWLGIFIIVIGVLCISKEKKLKKTIIYKKKSWMIWGLLGAVAIGIAEFVTKVATTHTDGFTFTFFVYLMYIPPFILFLFLDKKGRKFNSLKNKSGLFHTILGILFIEIGLIGIALAYQNGLASLVSPVVATHLLITAILAVIFLKEKLSTIQKIGILLDVVGVIVMGVWY